MIANRIAEKLTARDRVFIDAMIATLYLRKNKRFFDGLPWETLDIANVEVHERYRRKGVFTVMVEECEEAARILECSVVYVENIANPIVHDMLKRRGYEVVDPARPDLCMYKRITPL